MTSYFQRDGQRTTSRSFTSSFIRSESFFFSSESRDRNGRFFTTCSTVGVSESDTVFVLCGCLVQVYKDIERSWAQDHRHAHRVYKRLDQPMAMPVLTAVRRAARGSDIRGAGGSHTADAGRALRHSPYVVSYLRCVSMATRSFPFAHRMWLAVSSPAVLPHIDPSTCMSTPEYVVVLCSQSSYPGSSRFTLRTHPAHSRDPSYA